MIDAIFISAVGLQAQKEKLDATANNFANLSTTAYKRQSVDFSSILDRTALRGAAPLPSTESTVRSPGRMVRVDLAQGDLRQTGRALDVAISGGGFVEIELSDGVTGYSRAGSLQVSDDGVLVLESGEPLKADIRIPKGANAVEIHADGSVTASQDGDRAPTVVGQIELATFSNPESLVYRGEGVFTLREGANEPNRTKPGTEGAGRLVIGSLEGSNVRMVEEMVSLMLMQRVYELNSKVVQAADEMMGMSNSLRRT